MRQSATEHNKNKCHESNEEFLIKVAFPRTFFSSILPVSNCPLPRPSSQLPSRHEQIASLFLSFIVDTHTCTHIGLRSLSAFSRYIRSGGTYTKSLFYRNIIWHQNFLIHRCASGVGIVVWIGEETRMTQIRSNGR